MIFQQYPGLIMICVSALLKVEAIQKKSNH